MRISKILFFTSALFLSASCSDFLDINEDPNNPVTAPVSQLLPSSIVSMGSALDYVNGLNGFASNYMQQTVVRGDYNLNIMPFNDFTAGSSWGILYQRTLTDLNKVIELATASEDWHYVGIAQILKAYLYSYLVDYFGDVPYFKANQGSSEVNPEFDNGQNIYTDLFVLIDAGVGNLAKTSTISPGVDDLIYSGDRTKWKRFANTLKLKMYNQVRLKQDVTTQVNALIAEELIAADEQSFELSYGTSSGPDDRNPAYVQEYAPGASSGINPYFYEILRNRNSFSHGGNLFTIQDPRIPYYFYNQLLPGEAPENPFSYLDNSGFLSIYTFSFNIDPNEGFDQGASRTVQGLYPIGGRFEDGLGTTINNNGFGKVPLRLLPYFNVLFIQAELASQGIISTNSATILENAMRESFNEVNRLAAEASVPVISETTIDNYVSSIMTQYNVADQEQQLRIIMTQKWIASFGFAVDAFTDYRRTGYPVLHDGNTDNLTLTAQPRGAIVSFPYPQGDLELYANPPAQRSPYTSKVFWDN